ncbi:MAG: TerB family tellurite resistance protein [bacterium]
MFNTLKKLLLGNSEQKENAENDIERVNNKQLKIQLATCSIFLEIAYADDNFSDVERQTIIDIMKNLFSLEEEYVKELIQHAEELIKKSVSLYEFTEIIDHNFSHDEKYDIIENVWRIIYADNKLDQYEEYFAKKVSNNLNIPHKELIEAKLLVKEELKKATS